MSILGVSKTDILKCERASRFRDRDGIWRVDHVVLAIEHFETTPGAGSRAFHRPSGVGKRFQWLIKHKKIRAENEKRSERKSSSEDVQGPQVIHRGGADYH